MSEPVSHLVHTDGGTLAESTTSTLETGSSEPGPFSSAVERRVHIADVVGSIPTTATIRTKSGQVLPLDDDGAPIGPVPTLPERRSQRFVYFIMSLETERVKIGMAADPIERLCALQTACPEELGLLGWIVTHEAKTHEAELHAKFQKDHVRGEWFKLTNELMDFIEAEATRDYDELDRMTGRQTAWQTPQEAERPQAVPLALMPRGNGRKATLERYLLARGLSR